MIIQLFVLLYLINVPSLPVYRLPAIGPPVPYGVWTMVSFNNLWSTGSNQCGPEVENCI
jgi:hypothetical protein